MAAVAPSGAFVPVPRQGSLPMLIGSVVAPPPGFSEGRHSIAVKLDREGWEPSSETRRKSHLEENSVRERQQAEIARRQREAEEQKRRQDAAAAAKAEAELMKLQAAQRAESERAKKAAVAEEAARR